MHCLYIYEHKKMVNEYPEGIEHLINLGVLKPNRKDYRMKKNYYDFSDIPGEEELLNKIKNDASYVRRFIEYYTLQLNRKNYINFYDVIEYVNGSTAKYYCFLNDKTIVEVKF